MAINRTPFNALADDSGAGLDGTIITKALIASVLLDQIDAADAAEAAARIATDALKAPSASPAFTGVPIAPTAAPGNNTTQLATTAFVLANGAAAPLEQTTILTGPQNNFALGAGVTSLLINGATLMTLSGIAGGTPGRVLDIVVTGNGGVTLLNHSVLSISTNDIYTGGAGASVSVPAIGSTVNAVRLIYSSLNAGWILVPAADVPGVVQTTTSTGTVNDFALTTAVTIGPTFLRANNGTALTLTGLTAGLDGQVVRIAAIGAGNVVLNDQAAGSSAANRIITGIGNDLVLPAGTGRAELVYDATTARWRVIVPVPVYRCVAVSTAQQSIATATLAVCALAAEDFDSTGMHDLVTNNSRITIPPGGDGVYMVVGKVVFQGLAGGSLRTARLTKSGTAVGTDANNVPNANGQVVIVLSLIALVAGDYLELVAYQDSGSAMNVGGVTRAGQNELQAVRVAQ